MGALSVPLASTIGEVHAVLARGARACYPERARRFRQAGIVQLSFCVDSGGQAERVAIQSSGIDSLDEAVRLCVVPRAQPLPSGAKGQCFALGVEFGDEL